MSPANSASQPYVVITADTHSGGSLDMYREYLDPKDRDDFDAWRGSYRNPSKKHIGGKKTKNWDSAQRTADLEADGVIATSLPTCRILGEMPMRWWQCCGVEVPPHGSWRRAGRPSSMARRAIPPYLQSCSIATMMVNR